MQPGRGCFQTRRDAIPLFKTFSAGSTAQIQPAAACNLFRCPVLSWEVLSVCCFIMIYLAAFWLRKKVDLAAHCDSTGVRPRCRFKRGAEEGKVVKLYGAFVLYYGCSLKIGDGLGILGHCRIWK